MKKKTILLIVMMTVVSLPMMPPTLEKGREWEIARIMDINHFIPFSPKDMYEFMIRQKVIHHDIVFRQAIQESGHFRSKSFQHNNNPFGLKFAGKKSSYYKGSDSEGYGKFAHWKHAVMAYIDYQKDKINKGFDLSDYYAFLKKSKYAADPEYESKLKRINLKRYI